MTYPLKKTYRHQVEHDIPFPTTPKSGRKSGSADWAYPYDIMIVGESFFVAMEELGLAGSNRIANSIIQFHRKQENEGRRFIWRTRTIPENGELGVRVWRVE